MSRMNEETRLYVTVIGVNLDFLGLFLFIISLLKIYGESHNFSMLEISFVLVGSLMILIGLKGFNRNSPKRSVK